MKLVDLIKAWLEEEPIDKWHVCECWRCKSDSNSARLKEPEATEFPIITDSGVDIPCKNVHLPMGDPEFFPRLKEELKKLRFVSHNLKEPEEYR